MPTKHPRIAVIRDPELDEALRRAAVLVEGDCRAARLVHDLAVRGAEALVAEHERRREALRRTADWSVSEDPGFDRDVGKDIERLAYGIDE